GFGAWGALAQASRPFHQLLTRLATEVDSPGWIRFHAVVSLNLGVSGRLRKCPAPALSPDVQPDGLAGNECHNPKPGGPIGDRILRGKRSSTETDSVAPTSADSSRPPGESAPSRCSRPESGQDAS